MKTLQYKFTKTKLKKLKQDNKQAFKNTVRKGTIIATLIAASPFLFYLYEYVPDVKVWETTFFTYHSNWYESANVAAWVICMKLVPLILLLIWFFTCRHWWYHALLVPIAMYSYQIASAISEDYNIDALHIFYLLPIMAFIFPSIYIIRAKMFNKIHDADKTMEELEKEFMIKPKDFMGKLKQYF